MRLKLLDAPDVLQLIQKTLSGSTWITAPSTFDLISTVEYAVSQQPSVYDDSILGTDEPSDLRQPLLFSLDSHIPVALKSDPMLPGLQSSNRPSSPAAESILSSPLSSPPSSPAFISTPLLSTASTSTKTSQAPLPALQFKKKKATRRSSKKGASKKINHPEPNKRKLHMSHQNRKRKRSMQYDTVTEFQAREMTLERVLEEGVPVESLFRGTDAATRSSGFIGQNISTPGKVWSLLDLVGSGFRFGFELIKWDGCNSIPILEKADGRIIVVLVGAPANDPSYLELNGPASQLMEEVSGLMDFNMEETDHRRGKFRAKKKGYSFGGGQKYPKHFQQKSKDTPALQ
ncbi:hypothetical protein VKT23_016350 [Stygiomarasmius scandens]|uniref:Uncharacterized protein n=1 Tax=Marasmiellus scandens TaxID=2682957 RepID=A0ABR1IY87_9AGAR